MAEDLKTEGTAEDGALTVQVAETADGPAPSAQAAGPDAVAAVTLAAGTPLVQEVRPGQAIDIRGADATAMSLRQEGEALILDFGAAGAVELTGYFTAVEAGAPPVVTLDGNIQLPIGQLIAAVTQTDDLLEPAAGPAAGPGIPGGGANFTPTEIRSIGDGIDITDLLPPTGLQFSVPDPDPAPLLLGGEDLASTDPLPSTTIPGPNPPEPTPPPGAGDVAGTVQEAALADGSGGPGATTLTGTLPVTNGTISAIAFGGKVTEAAADGTITVENGLFRLVVDSTTGEYTFTLLDNTLDHDNTGAVGAGDQVARAFTYTATGEDGATATGTLTVGIDADGPTASLSADGAMRIAEDVPGTLTGMWTTPLGADGAGTVTFEVNGQTRTLGSDALTFAIPNAGVLTIDPDGTWSLDPASGTNADDVSFDVKVTATDSDGDVASDTLTLTVTDGPGPGTENGRGDPARVMVDEDGSAPTPGTIIFTPGSDAIASVAFGNAVDDVLTLSGEGSEAVMVLSIVGNRMIVGDADGNEVTLTLTPNADNTSVTVTGALNGAFNHLTGNGETPLTVSGITVVATDADGDQVTAHAEVDVMDDVPVAGDVEVDVSITAPTNVVFALDLTGSMTQVVPPDGTTSSPRGPDQFGNWTYPEQGSSYYDGTLTYIADRVGQPMEAKDRLEIDPDAGHPTRLELMKASLIQTVGQYAGTPVMLTFASFSNAGNATAEFSNTKVSGPFDLSTASGIAAAVSAIETLEVDLKLAGPSGGTDYRMGTDLVAELFDGSNDALDPTVEGGNQLYFLSDGAHTEGRGSLDNAVQTLEDLAGDTAVDLDITAVGISLGSGQSGSLEAIDEADGSNDYRNVENANDLPDVLGDLTSTTTVFGDILNGSDFGADGKGGVDSITVVDGGATYSAASAGPDGRLTITTPKGGELTLNFASGEFTYQNDQAYDAESFRFEIIDKDGDIATSTLNIRAGSAARIGTEEAETLIGGPGDDLLFGEGGDDTLLGGLGLDVLSGGDGNDVFKFEADGLGIADLITDYRNDGTEQDVLDLAGLFDGDAAAAIKGGDTGNYIRIEDGKLQVNVNGVGDDFQDVAEFAGGAPADVQVYVDNSGDKVDIA